MSSDELHLVMVRSSQAHAKILKVDTSEALEVPGVVGLVSHEDLTAAKSDVFCSDTVSQFQSVVNSNSQHIICTHRAMLFAYC